MCAAKSKAHQERSRRDKKRKKCSKGLDNCGHIEGLEALIHGQRVNQAYKILYDNIFANYEKLKAG